MTKWRLALLITFLSIAILYAALLVGPVSLDSWAIWTLESTPKTIVFDIRLPRVITAYIVGALLAISGAVFQGLLRNPLADPYVLGVSSGAGVGAALAILLGISAISHFGILMCAVLGAIASIFLVWAIVATTKVFSVTNFVLTGIMVNALFSAMMLSLLFFSGTKLHGIMYWLMGGLDRAPFSVVMGVVVVGLPIAALLTGLGQAINIMSAGDTFAKSVGINVSQFRIGLFILASLLTGLAVSIAGILGFIGLVVPHFVRLLIGSDYRWIIPVSFCAGGFFLVLCDTLSRTLLSYAQVPIGIVTSLIGAPIFLILLTRCLKRPSFR